MASVPSLYGLVLAGGQSRRMGDDKAALSLEGQTLLERAVALLADQLDTVYVSVARHQSNDPLRARFNLIMDEYSDLGPAAGLLSAHQHDPAVAWLVVACDMPLLDAELIRALIAGRDPSRDATAWDGDDGEGPEPLCAIYEPVTLAAFLNKVQSGGSPGPRAWLQSADTCLLSPDRPHVLGSANTPEEFETLTGRKVTPEQINHDKKNR